MTNNKESYEELDFGPIHIERVGRVIKIKSNWKEYEYQKFMNNVKNKRTELKKEIDEKIGELLQLVKTCDTFELLAPISVINLTSDPETYTEITHTGNESIVEYLIKIGRAHV